MTTDVPVTTVLIVDPHPDDDTLTMGVTIRNHLNAGYDVHVLLLTTGENSGVRTELGMDVPTFVAARTDELYRATRQIGVPTANVHVPTDRPPDGQLTLEQATAMITAFYDDHPGAWCKSYSGLAAPGRHVDHVTSGQAVAGLFATGLVTNWRCYVEPWLLPVFETANPTVKVGTETVADTSSVLRGYGEYQRQDPTAKMWGIGYRSVGGEFAQNTPPKSYYHVPVST